MLFYEQSPLTSFSFLHSYFLQGIPYFHEFLLSYPNNHKVHSLFVLSNQMLPLWMFFITSFRENCVRDAYLVHNFYGFLSLERKVSYHSICVHMCGWIFYSDVANVFKSDGKGYSCPNVVLRELYSRHSRGEVTKFITHNKITCSFKLLTT